MAIKDWNGFKKSGDTYIPNDATARAGVTATVDLLKDTTGWLGKNGFNGKATTKTAQGVTWAVDANDSNIVTVSGTPTGFEAFTVDSKKVLPVGDYVLSGISDMVNVVYNSVILYKNNVLVRDLQIYDDNAVHTFSILQSDDYDTIRVQLKRQTNGVACSGTGKIMITTPEEYALSPSYEPYHGSVEEVKADKSSVISALNDTVGWVSKNKNYHNAQTSTAGTVTYTVNADKTVELSGTTTTSTIKDLRTYTGAELKALGRKLVLSGGNPKAYLAIRTLSYTFIARSFGDAVEFDTSTLEDATTYYETIGVSVPSGGSVDLTGVVIYPMITTPEEYKLSPTYAPYHESVAEILATKDVTVTAGTDVTVNANTYVYSKAGVVTGSLRLEIGATLTAGATIATLSAIPKNTTYAIAIDNTDKSVIPIIIGNNGAVQLFGGFIPTSGNQLLIPIAYATA